MEQTNATDLFPELSNVLVEARKHITAAAVDESDHKRVFNLFKDFMKKNRYWPEIQVKGVHGTPLILLTNTYNKKVDPSFQRLYDQCRSTVIDPLAPKGEGIVINMGATIPERVNFAQYQAICDNNAASDAVFYAAMEGTVVYVYHCNGTWHYSTTSMPSLETTNYHLFFEEALQKGGLGGRADLEAQLDTSKSYSFVLVHHKSSKFLDYSSLLGSEYATLYLISVRDRTTLAEDALLPLPLLRGTRLPERFSNRDEVQAAIENHSKLLYGVIAKSTSNPMQVFLVMSDQLRQREEECLGHANEWCNMLYVYKKRNPEFDVMDYMEKYLVPRDWVPPVRPSYGTPVDPMELLDNVFEFLTLTLYNCYHHSTEFNEFNGSYRVVAQCDAAFPPAIRFHLTQMRNLHAAYNAEIKSLTVNMVFDYLCHHVNLKDFRILVDAVVRAELEDAFLCWEEDNSLAYFPDLVDLATFLKN